MGNILQNHDVLGIIYDLADNYNCALVSTEFYHIIKKNSVECKCNKLVKIFNKTQWYTDINEKCHGYYNNNYQQIKNILNLHPKFLKTLRQCHALNLYAIHINALTIKYIKNQTPDLCNLAIAYNPECIKYIKNQDEYCSLVMDKAPNFFKYINNPTYAMCLKAGKYNGLLLYYIKYQTLELCKLAVENNIFAFQYVNEKIQNDLSMYVLNKDYTMIKYFKKPEEHHYLEVYKSCPEYFNTLFKKYTSHNIKHDIKNNGLTILGGITHGNITGLDNEFSCAGRNNIYMGYNSGYNIVNTNNNIMIGNKGHISDDGIIKIGDLQTKNYQAGIYGTKVLNALPVYITADGQLGTLI